MMEHSFRPLVKWPRKKTVNPKRSPFESTYNQTMLKLEKELGYLRAKNIVIQLAITEREIRLDGLPYATARPSFPGVVLTFEKFVGYEGENRKAKFMPLNFPCDAFTTWQDNLRAIALALEALRKVDRYGVTSHQEQYTGWAQLPPAESEKGLSVEDAAAKVAQIIGGEYPAEVLVNSADNWRTVYRTLAQRFHPDANGGAEHALWNEFQSAAEVLKRHHWPS